jgi:hypothetical protein
MKLQDTAFVILSRMPGRRALTLDVTFADGVAYGRAAQFNKVLRLRSIRWSGLLSQAAVELDACHFRKGV